MPGMYFLHVFFVAWQCPECGSCFSPLGIYVCLGIPSWQHEDPWVLYDPGWGERNTSENVEGGQAGQCRTLVSHGLSVAWTLGDISTRK